MFFFFVCGEHTFRKELPGYEGVICQCHHCGNMSGHVELRRPFFTFCFIPIIPFTIKGYKDIVCHICNFKQPLESRPDVQAMANGGAGASPQQGGQQPSNNKPYQPGPPNPGQQFDNSNYGQGQQGQGPPPPPQQQGGQGPNPYFPGNSPQYR